MLVDLFQIEMLQTTVFRVMKKYHDKHDFCLWNDRITMILALCGGFKRIFFHYCVKKLQNRKSAKLNHLQYKIILYLCFR